VPACFLNRRADKKIITLHKKWNNERKIAAGDGKIELKPVE
jgi:hypothetical protein